MTDRFFIHCISKDDENLLHALALAYLPTPPLLSAMLQTDDLTETLGSLAQKYPFVIPAERQLHAVVRDYTLEKILSNQDFTLPHIRQMHQETICRHQQGCCVFF